MVGKRGIWKCAVATVLLVVAAAAGAQEGGPGNTRLLVTQVRVKPAMIDTWRTLERDQVVPALKKAGVKQYTVFETLVGDPLAATLGVEQSVLKRVPELSY